MQRIPEGGTAGVATAGRVAPAPATGPGGRAGLRLPWALLAALGGGGALAAAFPPVGIWPLAAAGAVIFGLLAVGQRLLLGLPGWPLAVGGWWVAAEAMRARWPYAFPWGRLAMSQAGAPTARWAAIGGPPLLSFLVAVTGAMLAWLVLRTADRTTGNRPPRVRRLLAAVAATAATAGVALAGGLLPVDGAGP